MTEQRQMAAHASAEDLGTYTTKEDGMKVTLSYDTETGEYSVCQGRKTLRRTRAKGAADTRHLSAVRECVDSSLNAGFRAVSDDAWNRYLSMSWGQREELIQSVLNGTPAKTVVSDFLA